MDASECTGNKNGERCVDWACVEECREQPCLHTYGDLLEVHKKECLLLGRTRWGTLYCTAGASPVCMQKETVLTLMSETLPGDLMGPQA